MNTTTPAQWTARMAAMSDAELRTFFTTWVVGVNITPENKDMSLGCIAEMTRRRLDGWGA